MIRPVRRRRARLVTALLVVSSAAAAPVVAPAHADPAPADDEPLRVSIESLSPSTVPTRGRVTVTGRVTNRSESTWTDLNVYLLTSAEPMGTSEELAEATQTDAATQVGERLTDPGLFDSIPSLAPGATRRYTLSVPRQDLRISGAPGVYWLGVHVLGANEDGRDGVADGRARTFVPLMQARGPRTSLSLVVPVKGKVRREPDGTLANLSGWQRLLSPRGRLGRVVQLAESNPAVPWTWAVDPAILDAAASVAADNPGMDTGPSTEASPETGSPSESPTPTSSPPTPSESVASPSSPSTSSPSGPSPSPTPPSDASPQAEQAAAWLDSFRTVAARHPVMSVPYGDLDVASVLRGGAGGIYRSATELGDRTMVGFGVAATPLVAPPKGYLPETVLLGLDDQTPVLMSDRALPEAPGPVLDSARGSRVVLATPPDAAGGPAPTPPFSALAVRQRILSEAAVHALSSERDEPLVVTTPQRWDPGARWQLADFATGLTVDWLDLVDLRHVLSAPDARPLDASLDHLVYPPGQRRAELPGANLRATRTLGHTGDVFASLLTGNHTVDDFLAKSGLLASSYHARARPRVAASRAQDTDSEVRFLMEKVRIDGPSFLTMSSEQGTFAVTIVNDLQESVTVGIRADTGSRELVIRPPDPVRLGAGQRASVRLRVTSNDIGVHSVTLSPTNPDGQALGNQTTFSVRSSQVGIVIWIVMGIGAAVLFVTAGIRIAVRIRERKATHGPVLKGGSA